MFGEIAANLQVLNIPKPLPVSKKSVVSITKILFINIILRTLSRASNNISILILLPSDAEVGTKNS